MNRFEIQDRLSGQWAGTNDSIAAESAMECARTNGNPAAVNQHWRWLAQELDELFRADGRQAALCLTWCRGYIEGATKILNRWLLAAIR